jgi:hypothetical protein
MNNSFHFFSFFSRFFLVTLDLRQWFFMYICIFHTDKPSSLFYVLSFLCSSFASIIEYLSVCITNERVSMRCKKKKRVIHRKGQKCYIHQHWQANIFFKNGANSKWDRSVLFEFFFLSAPHFANNESVFFCLSFFLVGCHWYKWLVIWFVSLLFIEE